MSNESKQVAFDLIAKCAKLIEVTERQVAELAAKAGLEPTPSHGPFTGKLDAVAASSALDTAE